jgi:26S proteasome regulatory subunit RPN2 C-terminal domain
VSNARPSLFAYPTLTKPPKKETVTKVATAVLSTTAKVKAREKKKAAAEGDAMDQVRHRVLPCRLSDNSNLGRHKERSGG